MGFHCDLPLCLQCALVRVTTATVLLFPLPLTDKDFNRFHCLLSHKHVKCTARFMAFTSCPLPRVPSSPHISIHLPTQRL
jgi:hypothetical protein